MPIEYLQLQLRQGLQVGLPALNVVEVLNLKVNRICPVPGVHPCLLGVTNWRGQLLWSLNLSDCLRLRKEAGRVIPSDQALTAVVLCHASWNYSLACVVSNLQGMIAVEEALIQPVPRKLPAAVKPFVQGALRQDVPLLLLKPEAILQAMTQKIIQDPRLIPSSC